MSLLNYILAIISIGAIIYTIYVGSTFGVVIWVIVFFLNLSLIIVERLKRKAMMMKGDAP